MPVLLLLGGESAAFFGRVAADLAKALPNSRTVVMPGQQHIAMDTGPELLVGAVLAFWRDIKLDRACAPIFAHAIRELPPCEFPHLDLSGPRTGTEKVSSRR